MSLLNKSRTVGKPANKKKTTYHSHKNLYSQLLITRTVPISINHIGSTIKETLEKTIASQIEGKCIVEGYIKPRSVEVITFSSGLVMGSSVIFEVVIQCEVCSPVEGMHISCIAKHINKAGIRAEINETPSPVVIFIARDHNYASPLFADVKENNDIKVRVIGQRFELNDKYISVIAEIVESNADSENDHAQAQQQVQQQAQQQAQPVTLKPQIEITTISPEQPKAPVSKKQATLRINRKPKEKKLI